MRPDVIVRLPGGKHVVIDAKAPLDAYLKALDAPDEATRQTLLADHAKQVRTHLLQLAAKGYAAHVQPSPDFVVMFLTGEMFFSAALEQDASLIEYRRGTTCHTCQSDDLDCFVAGSRLRLAAAGDGRERSQNQRAWAQCLRIGPCSRRTFRIAWHEVEIEPDAYNQAVGSLEGNVLAKARKFRDLQAANGGEEIKQLEPIDRVPRMLQAPELTGGLPFSDEEEVPAEEVEAV